MIVEPTVEQNTKISETKVGTKRKKELNNTNTLTSPVQEKQKKNKRKHSN